MLLGQALERPEERIIAHQLSRNFQTKQEYGIPSTCTMETTSTVGALRPQKSVVQQTVIKRLYQALGSRPALGRIVQLMTAWTEASCLHPQCGRLSGRLDTRRPSASVESNHCSNNEPLRCPGLYRRRLRFPSSWSLHFRGRLRRPLGLSKPPPPPRGRQDPAPA